MHDSKAKTDSKEGAKKAAGRYAINYIQNGMTIGLGTGSTSYYFIEALIEKFKEGLDIKAIATSLRSKEQAEKGGIPLISESELTTLDLVVDGADEVDPKNQMIKGAGGALLREKIIATSSKKMIVIVDEEKMVDQLGKMPLPVEITPFAWKATKQKLADQGFKGQLRQIHPGKYYITDNQNFILDIHFNNMIEDPEKVQRLIKEVPGVVDTGLFLNLASVIIIGKLDGTIEIRE